MSFEAALHGYLADAIASFAGRVPMPVYPMGRRPQGSELPAVTYQVVAGPGSHYSHGGVSDHEVSVQLDCWASDADDAIALADELREALDGFRGSWDEIRVGSVFSSVVMDDYEPTTRIHRRMRQYEIHYSVQDGS